MRELVATLTCSFMLLAGCSSDPAPSVTPLVPGLGSPATILPEWSYESNAIDLNIEADPLLNLFHKTPHTLLLCTYHLRDPNSFNQLQDEEGGLQRLLDCGRFDASVLYARKLVVQPGEKVRHTLDRSEGARYVGFAAGYYSMRKDRMIRWFSIPLTEVIRGGTLVQVPQKLAIDLRLGPQEILQVRNAPKLPDEKKEAKEHP